MVTSGVTASSLLGALTWLGPLLVAFGGSLGAICRYVLSRVIEQRTASRLPLGTMLVNIIGSFTIGLFTTAVVIDFNSANAATMSWVRLLLVTGFCGGFTTFSTAAVEATRLARDGHLALALSSVFGTLLCSLGAVVLGGVIASALFWG